MSDLLEQKVLIAADNREWKELYTREAERSGLIDADVCIGALPLLAKMGAISISDIDVIEEPLAAIFSDGLGGNWREIVSKAGNREPPVPVFVISTDERIQEDVESTGATFIYKGTLELGFMGVALAGVPSAATVR